MLLELIPLQVLVCPLHKSLSQLKPSSYSRLPSTVAPWTFPPLSHLHSKLNLSKVGFSVLPPLSKGSSSYYLISDPGTSNKPEAGTKPRSHPRHFPLLPLPIGTTRHQRSSMPTLQYSLPLFSSLHLRHFPSPRLNQHHPLPRPLHQPPQSCHPSILHPDT